MEFTESTAPAQPAHIIPFDPNDVKPWEINYEVDESKPNTWSFQKIRLGMKEEEVIAILGKPLDSFGPIGGGSREKCDSKWLFAPEGQDGLGLDILNGTVIRIHMRSDQIAESTSKHWVLNRKVCPHDLASLISNFGAPNFKYVYNDGTVRT